MVMNALAKASQNFTSIFFEYIPILAKSMICFIEGSSKFISMFSYEIVIETKSAVI